MSGDILASSDMKVASHLVYSQTAMETTAVSHCLRGTIPAHSTP